MTREETRQSCVEIQAKLGSPLICVLPVAVSAFPLPSLSHLPFAVFGKRPRLWLQQRQALPTHEHVAWLLSAAARAAVLAALATALAWWRRRRLAKHVAASPVQPTVSRGSRRMLAFLSMPSHCLSPGLAFIAGAVWTVLGGLAMVRLVRSSRER